MRSRALVFASVSIVAACSTPPPPPPVEIPDKPIRRFHIEVEVTVPSQKPGETVELWVPAPVAREGVQIVEDMSEKRGQVFGRFVHVKANEPVSARLNHVIERREVTTPAETLACMATELSEQEKKDLAPYLEPERENPLDDKTREIARWIAPEEKAFTRIARGVYDHVLLHMRYEKPPGKGWGRGSVQWACTEGYGNCTDFHALFMNLCRVHGIPARFAMGVSIPRERTGEIDGYHCWCEFYVPGHGWVPVDASEASKHPEKKDYFFGHLDANRVLLVEGRDLTLEPKQAAGPINILSTGYAEIDGRPVPVKRQLHYVELQ